MVKPTDQRLFLQVARAHRLLTGFLKDALGRAGLGITPAQAGMLFLLRERDGRKMSELAGLLLVDNSALTRLADRLEKAGLLTRRPSPDDRRAALLCITQAGQEAAELAAGVVNRANADLVALLTAGELEALTAALTKLTARCAGGDEPSHS